MPAIAPVSLKPVVSPEFHAPLAELSAEIFRESGALMRAIPAQATQNSLSRLLSGMNSYYSNLIEGVKTLPVEVDEILYHTEARDPKIEDRQQLAFAHIECERAMRAKIAETDEDVSGAADVYSPDFIRWLHAEFYGHLPPGLRATQTRSGDVIPVLPGEFRDRGVTVGAHHAPEPQDLRDILAQYSQHFASEDWLATDRLIAVAAAHHRLAWIHPFVDGNGRVARLFSHAGLMVARVDGGGLWSLSRGLARTRSDYYQALSVADAREPFGDRERLSAQGLGEFSQYFLTVLLDQITFMSDLLDLTAMSRRIERYVMIDLAPPKHGEALARLLRALWIEGEITRGEVRQITGLRDTAAREVINLAFEHRLVRSPSVKGKLTLGFPNHVLDAWLPRLYLDLPV